MARLLGYYRSEPVDYVLLYRNGKVVREGAGIAFFYWAPTTSVVSIPTSTIDVPFILNETTSNFQAVTVQGQVTYRVSAPSAAAAILNFTIDPRTGAFTSTDPDKLPQRILNAVQTHLRPELAKRSLEDAVLQAAEMAAAVLERIKADTAVQAMGVECLSVFVSAVRPTPEMAKALEAEYREGLQQRADQAIYARRAAAVEQERRIKENELSTEVTLEEKRRELVDLRGENANRQAEYDARSNDHWLQPWRDTDPRVVLALALKLMGENAERIGNLTITPDLLSSVLAAKE